MAHSCLADFRIEKRLGSGSFGTVYRARRLADDCQYVIKTVAIAELSDREKHDAINEVKLLARMDSPFVVKYYDSFLETDTLHIVMEYCNRGDLNLLIKKTKKKGLRYLPEARIWDLFVQICLGLHYIHSHHVLHRDMKAANVFLSKDPETGRHAVKIGDLGVAKLLGSSASFASTIVGTPYCLSPELCEDKPYNRKSDVWALGVILYECCTLRHPFDANNQCALILKIIQARHAPVGDQVHPDLAELVSLCLTRDHHRRPNVSDILRLPVVQRAARERQIELPEDLADWDSDAEDQPTSLCDTASPASSPGPRDPSLAPDGGTVHSRLTQPVHPNGELGGGRHLAKRFGPGRMRPRPSAAVPAHPTDSGSLSSGFSSGRSSAGDHSVDVRGGRVRGGGPRILSQAARGRHRRPRPHSRPPSSAPAHNGAGSRDSAPPTEDEATASVGPGAKVSTMEMKMAYYRKRPLEGHGRLKAAAKPTIADLKAALSSEAPSFVPARIVTRREDGSRRVPLAEAKTPTSHHAPRQRKLGDWDAGDATAANGVPRERGGGSLAPRVSEMLGVPSTKSGDSFRASPRQPRSDSERELVDGPADGDTDTDADPNGDTGGLELGGGRREDDTVEDRPSGWDGHTLRAEYLERAAYLRGMTEKAAELRRLCLEILGPACFKQLYELLGDYWTSAESTADPADLDGAEAKRSADLAARCEELAVAQTGSIVSACEAIFHIQQLLAHEVGIVEAEETLAEVQELLLEEAASAAFEHQPEASYSELGLELPEPGYKAAA